MPMFLLSFFDGTTFFVGLALTMAGAAILLLVRQRQVRRMAVAGATIGVAMAIVSAVALPLWAYAIWGVAVLAALALGARTENMERSGSRRRIAASVLFVATAGMVLAELPHHFAPHVSVPNGGTIFVVGDSLSAGIGRKERCWPDVLGERLGVPVVNLAMGGATARTAMAQAESVDRPGSVVIVEIGGNDLLGGTSAVDFRSHLDELLSALHARGHRLVMFELPLYPFRNALGSAQRELAAKYGVTLIPKRFLTRVMGMADGTLDGLHFSQKGHDAMAEQMAEVLVREARKRE
jgi:acyl-CoA thioesterase I